ncbi:MAG: suppressor of fused domain protein [Bradymonadaceae bacterium]
MSNSNYLDALLDTYQQALDREGQIIGELEGPDQTPPIHVVLFPATAQRPIAKLATAGMSAMPMTDGDGESVHLELSMSFPSAWEFDAPDQQWPIEELLRWASYTMLEDVMVWPGNTLVSESDETLAEDNDFAGWIAVDPFFVPDDATPMAIANFEVDLLDMVPLYPEELSYADQKSADALFLRLHHAGIQPLVAPHRQNVCAPEPV